MDDPNLDALAFKFFKEFARCEYSLKMVGLRSGTDRKPTADWPSFAQEVGAILEHPQSPELQAAVSYYLQNPPQKQVVQAGLLAWENILPSHNSNAELVLLLVCRVRNNLFHGGKFNGHWFEPQRSTELLAHALVILSAVVSAHAKVSEAYSLHAA